MVEKFNKRKFLAVLAILEMITFLVSIGVFGYFVKETGNTLKKLLSLSSNIPVESIDILQLVMDLGGAGRHEYFISSVGIGLFTAILSLMLTITNRQEKTFWAANMVTAHAFSALILLISASLLKKTVETYNKDDYLKNIAIPPICKTLEYYSGDTLCNKLTIAVIFGFLAMGLFVGDTIIYIYILVKNEQSVSSELRLE